MEFTWASSSGLLSSMLMETCLEGEAAISATVISVRTTLGFFVSELGVSECFSFCPLTFGGHGSLCSDDIWVTPELLQSCDGALTHHRLPAKRTVVDHLQHNRRRVHLILWKELDRGQRGNIRHSSIVNLQYSIKAVRLCSPITTLMKRTELGKFGLFFMFLMTADSNLCPPHSTTRLGDDTEASWYGFMFLRPHARIWIYTQRGGI